MVTRIGLYLAGAGMLLGTLSVPANAAPSSRLLQIQAKVNYLREAAASAAFKPPGPPPTTKTLRGDVVGRILPAPYWAS